VIKKSYNQSRHSFGERKFEDLKDFQVPFHTYASDVRLFIVSGII